MRKFYLKSVISGCPDNNIVCVDGFAKAEEKAKEMLSKILGEGWSNIDTYVCLSENERDVMFLDTDMYILVRGFYGELTWFKNIYGTYCYVCERIINDEEEAELDEWRNEKEVHVLDLSDDDLKKLRGEISVGSCYLSDYENSFYIDENEVYDYSEKYEEYIDELGLEDTPQNFAYYIKECA